MSDLSLGLTVSIGFVLMVFFIVKKEDGMSWDMLADQEILALLLTFIFIIVGAAAFGRFLDWWGYSHTR